MDDILDYDLYLQRLVSQEFRCIYPFWNDKFSEKGAMKICGSQKTLKEIFDYTHNYTRMMSNKSIPCVEQYTTVTWNYGAPKMTEKHKMLMKISYMDKYYQEIKYSENFGLESVISNVGGFVGIFLGSSMMQLPQILGII